MKYILYSRIKSIKSMKLLFLLVIKTKPYMDDVILYSKIKP